MLSVRLSADEAQAIRNAAKATGRTYSEIVRTAVEAGATCRCTWTASSSVAFTPILCGQPCALWWQQQAHARAALREEER